MSKSQNKTGCTLSGLVRTSLKEIESQQYGGLSREHVWEWFCAKHGVTVTKATFVNLLYRARKRAKKEQIKKAQLAGLSVQQATPLVPSPQRQPSQQVNAKKEKKTEPQVPEKKPNYLADWKAFQASEKNSDPIEIIKKLRAEGKIK